MKEEQEKIKLEIQSWIEENKYQLSPNTDTWSIEVYENEDAESPEPIQLGKYNAEVTSTDPFYKPYSKTFLL
ncbi:hypothetical protein CLU96_3234 [Chryseobacterium sp. 52]|uniref:hypothetical protein n=1 Tax=Chryseobacterium sp. 52 TaxID=2035213 RepID=UPI000C17B5EA|nr:hypothetical protein [Chryseobacterium sp. 52]PIF46210.1 hypothetical protein CLU96_3234 [Chryseobacterium sp. 52]